MAVPGRVDVGSWSAAERAQVARLLDELVERPAIPNRPPARRRAVLVATFGGTLVLLPWIIILSVTLPDTASGGAWRLTWVGFDVALATALLATGWLVWHRRQLVVVLLGITATLLTCDAWFDVCLSWGTREQFGAIMTAAFAELPLVALMVTSAVVSLRRSSQVINQLRGVDSGPVPWYRQELVMLPTRQRSQ